MNLLKRDVNKGVNCYDIHIHICVSDVQDSFKRFTINDLDYILLSRFLSKLGILVSLN